MPTVFLRDPYVTHSDINECLKRFQLIRSGEEPPQLIIEAREKMLDIDMLLLGYLVLFKELFEDIEIAIRLPFNAKRDKEDFLHHKLEQFGVYAYLMTGKGVFRVLFKDGSINFSLASSGNFPGSWLELSGKFTLPFLVTGDDEFYRLLFRQSISSQFRNPLYEGIPNVPWDINSKDLYSAYREKLVDDPHANPAKRTEIIQKLAFAAYYKCVDNAGVLSIYLDPAFRKNRNKRNYDLQVSGLQSRTEGDTIIYEPYIFFERIEYVFRELSDEPLITQFLFAILTSQEMLPGKINRGNKDAFVTKFCGLWNFTKELVRGLLELTKNISQHLEPGETKGVVSVRVYTGALLESLKNKTVNGGALYTQRIEKHHQEITAFIDVNVIDLGSKGIMTTLLQKTEEAAATFEPDDLVHQMLLDDAALMRQNHVKLENLLDIHEGYHLNQQSKRSIAHLGLLIFSKLIDKNNGLMVVTSTSPGKEPDLVILPRVSKSAYDPVILGTHFKVLLPVRPEEAYQPVVQAARLMPSDSSVTQIRGLERLLSYQVWDIDKAPENRPGDVTVISFRLPEIQLGNDKNNESILWKTADQVLKKAIVSSEATKKRIIHLDFGDMAIDESQLFRFLGRFEIVYPGEHLLVSNVPATVFQYLCQINRAFFEKNAEELPFWNERAAVVIYSFVKEEKKEPGKQPGYFYFTDALWGRTNIDFVNINRLIHRNHFNSVSLLFGEEYTSSRNVVIQDNPAFYADNVLLPFDLLLKGVNGITMFESNAMMLLKNEIKPKLTA